MSSIIQKIKPLKHAASSLIDFLAGIAVPVVAGSFLLRRWLKKRSDKKKADATKTPAAASKAPSTLSTPSKVRRDFKVKRERSEASAAAYEERQRQLAAIQATSGLLASGQVEQGDEEEGQQGEAGAAGVEDQAAFFKMLQSLGFKVVDPNDGSGKVFLVPPEGQEGGEGDEDMDVIEEGDEGAWVGRRGEEGEGPSSSRDLRVNGSPNENDNDDEEGDFFDEGDLELGDENDDILLDGDNGGIHPMSDDEVGRRLMEALERMGRKGEMGEMGGYLDDEQDFEEYEDDDDDGGGGGYMDHQRGEPGRDEVLRMMDAMMADLDPLDPGGITPDFDYEPDDDS